jgi:hypothetical protein
MKPGLVAPPVVPDENEIVVLTKYSFADVGSDVDAVQMVSPVLPTGH